MWGHHSWIDLPRGQPETVTGQTALLLGPRLAGGGVPVQCYMGSWPLCNRESFIWTRFLPSPAEFQHFWKWFPAELMFPPRLHSLNCLFWTQTPSLLTVAFRHVVWTGYARCWLVQIFLLLICLSVSLPCPYYSYSHPTSPLVWDQPSWGWYFLVERMKTFCASSMRTGQVWHICLLVHRINQDGLWCKGKQLPDRWLKVLELRACSMERVS